jgi:hypothetical protein
MWRPYVETLCGDLMWRPYVETLCGDLMWRPYVETLCGDPFPFKTGMGPQPHVFELL